MVGTQVSATRVGPLAADQLAHRVRVDAALRQVGRADDLDAEPAGEREVHDLVRGVVGPAGQDAFARGEVEGADSAPAKAVVEFWLSAMFRRWAPSSRPRSSPAAASSRRPGLGGLVAAELVLEVEVGVDRLANLARDQGRSRIVEVGSASQPGVSARQRAWSG